MKSKEEVVQEFRIASIQEAALRVIARRGMSAATMQEIADEARVAKGTIYLYFRDRDDLVEKTFESAMAHLMERVDKAMALELPFDQKLRAILAAKLAFFSENREFFRLFLSLRMPEGSPDRQRRQKRTCQPQYQARVEKFTRVIEQAMERGEIRRTDPQRLAIFIMEGSTAVILERLTEESPPAEEADVEFMAGLLLDGARKRTE